MLLRGNENITKVERKKKEKKLSRFCMEVVILLNAQQHNFLGSRHYTTNNGTASADTANDATVFCKLLLMQQKMQQFSVSF